MTIAKRQTGETRPRNPSNAPSNSLTRTLSLKNSRSRPSPHSTPRPRIRRSTRTPMGRRKLPTNHSRQKRRTAGSPTTHPSPPAHNSPTRKSSRFAQRTRLGTANTKRQSARTPCLTYARDTKKSTRDFSRIISRDTVPGTARTPTLAQLEKKMWANSPAYHTTNRVTTITYTIRQQSKQDGRKSRSQVTTGQVPAKGQQRTSTPPRERAPTPSYRYLGMEAHENTSSWTNTTTPGEQSSSQNQANTRHH